MNNRVTVVGSYNVGLFLKGEAIPKGGETLIGQTFYESGGGKGSNQAVAAQKMGAQTVFIGSGRTGMGWTPLSCMSAWASPPRPFRSTARPIPGSA